MREADGGMPTSHTLTRREALSLSAAALLAGCMGPDTRDTSAVKSSGSVKFARGAVIRTLLKDVPPASLSAGAVLFHEHLSMKYPPNVKEHFTDDVGLMVEEVRAAGRDGISCIVDGGHPDMTRSLDALKRIATESGVAIVASGGYYMQRTYPPEIAGKSADQIADELVREAKEQRLGAFGEIGQQGGLMTEDERKVFQAIAKAQVRSHLPIFTHNAYTGTRQVATAVPTDTALRQLDVLEEHGAKPGHVAIGHVCCLDEPSAATAIQIAKRGAFVGFDRVTIQGILSDEKRVAMLMKVVDAGFADRLLISSDFAVAAALKQRGGPGVAQAWTVFGPMLVKAGLPEATLRSIMIDNPRRFLAFVPA
jgi:phosphotriesterase-related protein